MTDLLEDFEEFYIKQGIVDALHRDTILDEPNEAQAIYEYQGTAGIAQIASSTRSVQIVARSTKATSAKLKAREMYNALVTEDGIINLTDERWALIHLRQPPFKMKIDGNDRVYYCFNASVTTYND